MNVCREFYGKKITLMGLGLLGRGVGDAAYLAECGAKLTITDLKTKEQLKDSIDRLSQYPGIEYVLGEHRLLDFRTCDMVLKAAGVPFDSLYIAEAHAHRVPVVMSGALFAKYAEIPVIGITGSRGKSTTTQLIYHTLSQSTEGGTVHLGGNVRGVSNLQLLKGVEEGDIAVMELDSWQLQGFGDSEMSPHIAVFTSFLPDHMDYYQNNMDAYFDDKAHIFAHQELGDVLVTTPNVFVHIEAYAKRKGYTLTQEVVLTDASDVPADWQVQIPGEHNRANVALAIAALRATSLAEEFIKEGIESFTALPGRLELISKRGGIKVYNDNNATSPAATRAGILAVAEETTGNIILIMGGSDKKLDMEPLFEVLPKVKEVLFLTGTGTETMRARIPYAPVFDSLGDVVKAAYERAKEGDTILFSPAFASFGMFKNEYDRNDQFVALIHARA